MTAEEYFKEHLSGEPLHQDVVIEAMIEFAKYHVEQALKSASENADITDNGRFPIIDKKSILTAYLLENIK